MADLEDTLVSIYQRTLYRASPTLLGRRTIQSPSTTPFLDEPVSLVVLGKSASSMFKAAGSTIQIAEAIAVLPEGYREDAFPPFVSVHYGSHPEITELSFTAADALVEFVANAKYPLIFMISGGTSACVARPLEPWFSHEDLIEANGRLVRSGLRIEEINTVRKHLSAIKGGRLVQDVEPGFLTFVLSDVGRGMWKMVGSGPTFEDSSTNLEAASALEKVSDPFLRSLAERLRDPSVPDTPDRVPESRGFLLGDNQTLVNEALAQIRQLDIEASEIDVELDDDVGEVTEILWERASKLESGEMAVGGGEPTVMVEGKGRGGRCSEIAVRLGMRAKQSGRDDLYALLGSSDGLDGDTDAAGYVVTPRRYGVDRPEQGSFEAALKNSNSWSVIDGFARTIKARPGGNNLRDLFVLARL